MAARASRRGRANLAEVSCRRPKVAVPPAAQLKEGGRKSSGEMTMSPDNEQLYRKAFRDLLVSLFGHQDEAELECDWQRFRDERMPAVLTEARKLTDVDGRGKFMLEQMTIWCHEQAMTIALSEPNKGYAADWELQPDGTIKQMFFRRKPRA
jgi:hypothetical protein